MSLALRQHIVSSTNTYFQSQSQRSDILNPAMVRDETIALIWDLISAGHIIEFTAIRSDHHDDSSLGPLCHAYGAAFDCWPLLRHAAGSYADASDPQMKSFLHHAYTSPRRGQVGLAGSAAIDACIGACGLTTWAPDFSLFQDDGGDHIHISAKYTTGLEL